MSIFFAPAFVLIFALAVSARMTWLKNQGKEHRNISKSLLAFVWIWFVLSAFLALTEYHLSQY